MRNAYFSKKLLKTTFLGVSDDFEQVEMFHFYLEKLS